MEPKQKKASTRKASKAKDSEGKTPRKSKQPRLIGEGADPTLIQPERPEEEQMAFESVRQLSDEELRKLQASDGLAKLLWPELAERLAWRCRPVLQTMHQRGRQEHGLYLDMDTQKEIMRWALRNLSCEDAMRRTSLRQGRMGRPIGRAGRTLRLEGEG